MKIKKLSKIKKIELAKTEEIDKYKDIAKKFIKKIFGINSFLITDLSHLSDFVEFDKDKNKFKENEEKIYKKIEKIYGINVRNKKTLIDIFKAIQ
jgi:hypothetical protein